MNDLNALMRALILAFFGFLPLLLAVKCLIWGPFPIFGAIFWIVMQLMYWRFVMRTDQLRHEMYNVLRRK